MKQSRCLLLWNNTSVVWTERLHPLSICRSSGCSRPFWVSLFLSSHVLNLTHESFGSLSSSESELELTVRLLVEILWFSTVLAVPEWQGRVYLSHLLTRPAVLTFQSAPPHIHWVPVCFYGFPVNNICHIKPLLWSSRLLSVCLQHVSPVDFLRTSQSVDVFKIRLNCSVWFSRLQIFFFNSK